MSFRLNVSSSLRAVIGSISCALLLLASVQTSTAANIAWISFHSADNAPSSGAAGLGFTTAPDKGYTDLLTGAGHTVTRIVTNNDLDVTPLNNYDLVIIGRSIDSSHYQQANETLAFNTTITKPLIFMSGYIERQNRLGFSTGSTIPDTSGTVHLTVANPLHPIFAGVSVDGSNLMVNPYANIVLNPIDGVTSQRGISAVTEGLAGGGTLLASVGTPGDAAVNNAIIAEWNAGATLANAAPANVLGGHRLMFLSGSREQASGGSSQMAGILDLGPDGIKMFLNAVNYMAVPVPEPTTFVMAAFGALGLALARRRVR